MSDAACSTVEHDVLIVGCGPVGEMLAILLAQGGWRVGIVERWASPYRRPRAVHFDHEIARVFAAAGVGDKVAAISEPAADYDWRNADGQTLIHFDWGAEGASGWPVANTFSQPDLESVLAAHAASFPTATVSYGQEAVRVADVGDHVVVELLARSGERSTVRASYVVGCDGANSFVREQMATTMTDLGFGYDWLIVDVIPHEQREWKPVNLQICDPARPTTLVSGGPGRRRWEFMRLPTETVTNLNTEETAWRLLAPWHLSADNAELERHAVYTFQARWADQWRIGRVLLAGDAAHLMPPFAGQGMCSGIRDAANLAWKLNLVISGKADPVLLDSYTSERSAHVQNAIGMSVELGNVICLTDPAAVAARDEVLLKAGGDPTLALGPIPPPVLGPGVLHTDSDGALVAPAGQLSAQGRVAGADGIVDRFDQIVGGGFVVASIVDLGPVLTPRLVETMERIGARLVQVVAPGTATDEPEGVKIVVDVEDFYLPHMREAGDVVAIVRPDFYIFGTARSLDELPALIDELASRLSLVGDFRSNVTA